jgi:DeoR/GlpR family transcriptional regulator of sugar metabolism
MRPKDRQNFIADLVQRHGQVTVEDLANQLNASRETIRRDLAAMDQKGVLRKHHGGARSGKATARVNLEGSFSVRMAENVDQKHIIGQRAAALFRDGDVLFVDSGSTTAVFAEYLSRHRGLRVITNSLLVAEIMGNSRNGHRITLLGGDFEPDGKENLGPMVLEQINQIHAEHLVLTVGGVHPGGVRDFDIREAEVARAMIKNAAQVTVIADRTKLNRGGIFDVAGFDSITRFVTDTKPPQDIADAMMAASVEIIVS